MPKPVFAGTELGAAGIIGICIAAPEYEPAEGECGVLVSSTDNRAIDRRRHERIPGTGSVRRWRKSEPANFVVRPRGERRKRPLNGGDERRRQRIQRAMGIGL